VQKILKIGEEERIFRRKMRFDELKLRRWKLYGNKKIKLSISGKV